MNNNNNNDGVQNINRRGFLKTTTGLALVGAGTMLMPSIALADGYDSDISQFHGNNSDRKLWSKVRKQFVLNKRTTYMNIGTSGSMPKSVLANFDRNNEMISKNPWQSNVPTIELAKQVAHGFGADEHEIVLNRNTTDGMCTIINGLNFEPGDVILTTNHEHPGLTVPVKVVAERFGVEVVYLELPVYTKGEEMCSDDFVKVFADAVEEYGSRVRLMTFSHVTWTTGTALPVERICKEVAIPNRIITLIDGAHTPGMLNLNFHDIDCDFYSGAGHKWQCGAGATGILYVRDNANRLYDFWSDRDTPLWCINSSSSSTSIQAQLQGIGQDNYPAKQAFVDCCEMWQAIGRDVIEERILDLSELCKNELTKHFRHAPQFAPNVRELSSGLSSFNPFDDQYDGDLLLEFRNRLDDEYGYIVRTVSFYKNADDYYKTHVIRISTHLFHDEDDVIGVVKAMKRLYREMA